MVSKCPGLIKSSHPTRTMFNYPDYTAYKQDINRVFLFHIFSGTLAL